MADRNPAYVPTLVWDRADTMEPGAQDTLVWDSDANGEPTLMWDPVVVKGEGFTAEYYAQASVARDVKAQPSRGRHLRADRGMRKR